MLYCSGSKLLLTGTASAPECPDARQAHVNRALSSGAARCFGTDSVDFIGRLS
jgi:hypothetical protein